MIYAEYTLSDLGYHLAAIGGPGEIFGLDNRLVDEEGFEDDQRFRHLMTTGYPEGAARIYERPDRKKCLAVFGAATELPVGGTVIPAADVVALLMSDYAWPMGTAMVDGLPVRPEGAL